MPIKQEEEKMLWIKLQGITFTKVSPFCNVYDAQRHGAVHGCSDVNESFFVTSSSRPMSTHTPLQKATIFFLERAFSFG